MKLQHLIQQVYYEPSIITPQAHASIRQLLESRLGQAAADPPSREPGRGFCGEHVEVEQMEIIDGIAHIPIGGAIGQKLTGFERGEGAVDVAEIAREIDFAESSDQVEAVIFDIDSPGGMVSGTPELADKIAAMEKTAFTFSNGMIASAAYWLASATDGIFTTKTAATGSIGVYLPVMDVSRRFEAEGVKVELIKAGKLKGLGFPGTAMTEEGRDHLQARVNEIYAMFTGFVTDRRGEISSDTMQGQVFLARESLERGLIDQIVTSKDDVVRMLQ